MSSYGTRDLTDALATYERLEVMIYELLDAHDDTARLAMSLAEGDPEWALHLGYLRDLQRVGRELLARACAGGGR